MLYKVLVILHLLGATIWVGGHIVLIAGVLPAALRKGDPAPVLEFERFFARLGLSALAVQVITGVWLAHIWLGGWTNLGGFSMPAAGPVVIKLALLFATLAQAGWAYHRVLPKLRTAAVEGGPPGPLRSFARHAWITGMLAVLMVIVGASVRLGGVS